MGTDWLLAPPLPNPNPPGITRFLIAIPILGTPQGVYFESYYRPDLPVTPAGHLRRKLDELGEIFPRTGVAQIWLYPHHSKGAPDIFLDFSKSGSNDWTITELKFSIDELPTEVLPAVSLFRQWQNDKPLPKSESPVGAE